MTIEDTIRRTYVILTDLKSRILELESEHGEIAGFHFGTSMPSSPYPNQVVVRTDITPPAGGTIYRYDQASSAWLRLN